LCFIGIPAVDGSGAGLREEQMMDGGNLRGLVGRPLKARKTTALLFIPLRRVK